MALDVSRLKYSSLEPFEFMADIGVSKVYPVEISKATETTEAEGKFVVEGFASTTDLDSQNHTITKEAIEQGALSLQTYTTLLFNHDPNRPIGHIEKAEAQDGKLFIKAIISPSEIGIWKKIQDGTLSKFSVFGKILDAEEGTLDSKQILVIKSMELYEVSVVSVPANAAAKTLAWYVEKALMFSKGQETGFSPQTLVPLSWATAVMQKRGFVPFGDEEEEEEEEEKPGKNKKKRDGGKKPMATKNTNVEQALELLRLALAEADDDSRQQIESNIAALESLQKGEGPMDNDPENKRRMGQARGGSMGVNTFPTNFPPDTKKVSVGSEANLALAGEGEVPTILDFLENALISLQNANPDFEDDDVAINARVIQWIEANIAKLSPTTSVPGVGSRTARASADTDGFSKAIKQLQTIAKDVTNTATGNANTVEEMRAIQKSVNETAAAISAVATQLMTTSMRKGQGPAVDTGERDGNENEDALALVAKSVGVDAFKNMSPMDKTRLYLNSRVLGH